MGCSIGVFGTEDEHTQTDLGKWHPVVPRCVPHYGNDSFRYAPSLQKELLASNFDLCHLHSLWSYTSLVASRWTEQKKRPLLVSTNGMLDSWALKNSRWKKRLISLLIERRMLTRAACIQANTEKDVADYRRFGLSNPIAVIPNGVYAPDATSIASSRTRFSNGSKKQAVYLGRIHPKKGLANLIHAWGKNKERMRRGNWRFIIAGKDEGGHLGELVKLCAQYDLSTRTTDQHTDADVCIMGPTYGAEKFKLLTGAHLFVLPSFSEGIPMAVLEAWAHGTPTMMSAQCNLGIGFDACAAISVEPTVESVSNGLMLALELRDEELTQMSYSARKLVEEQFGWMSIAKQMHMLYGWLIGGGSRPDFVTL